MKTRKSMLLIVGLVTAALASGCEYYKSETLTGAETSAGADGAEKILPAHRTEIAGGDAEDEATSATGGASVGTDGADGADGVGTTGTTGATGGTVGAGGTGGVGGTGHTGGTAGTGTSDHDGTAPHIDDDAPRSMTGEGEGTDVVVDLHGVIPRDLPARTLGGTTGGDATPTTSWTAVPPSAGVVSVLDPIGPAPASGVEEQTLNLATRDEEGVVTLCQGKSETAWKSTTAPNYRCIALNHNFDRAAGNVAAVYANEKIHLFFRNRTNGLSYIYCPARDPRPETCILKNRFAVMTENPSAVAAADGTLFVFFQQNTYSNQIAYIQGKGGEEEFGLHYVNEVNPDGRTASSCGPIWYSPSATVKKESDGRETVAVFARDDDAFNGHLRMARLTDPTAAGSDQKWSCDGFNYRDGADNTGPIGLGSTPAAFFNLWTNAFDVYGKEQGNLLNPDPRNRVVLWSTRTRPDASMGLENAIGLSDRDTMPVAQFPALAVHKNGQTDGSVHFLYTANGVLNYGKNMTPANPSGFVWDHARDMIGNPTGIGTADTSPALVVDEQGTLHAFTVETETADPQDLFLHSVVHLYKKTTDARWQREAFFPRSEVPSAKHASPTLILTPGSF